MLTEHRSVDFAPADAILNRSNSPLPQWLRLFARTLSPLYAGPVFLRNKLFDAGILSVRRLPRPVICIGNITVGGTGKTPMIRWLASQLRDEGRRVGVLSRGYKARPGELGDELTMLGNLLNTPGEIPIDLRANPNRYEGGQALLRDRPKIDLFLLDDGFQHRALGRDLDVVLISALSPFGFGRLLPAGRLRESLPGLRRAGVFIITHADQADAEKLAKIEQIIRRYNASAPIVRASHALTGFRSANAAANEPPNIPLTELAGRTWMPFCGIANFGGFVQPLKALAGEPVDVVSFGDHHDYAEEELVQIRQLANERGASVLVTTEKDWVKLARFPIAFDEALPIWRTELQIEFEGKGESELLDVIRACLRSARSDR